MFKRVMASAVMVLAMAAGGAWAQEKPAAPVEILREKPPVIILKLDDLKPSKGGGIPYSWKKFLDYLDTRHLKYGVGMIAGTAKDANPDYIKWVKGMRDSGNVEIWFHGWDHAVHEENGTKYNEFNGRSYEDQLKRVADSQALAMETFGFHFETFGPGGGVGSASLNEDTLKAMHEDPYMKVILYPSPMNAIGQALNEKGKVLVLDRVWAVGLEAKTFVPDSAKFIEGYKKNLTREYFVLQGHPTHWDAQRHEEVVKILDFLTSQKARFMLPMEYYCEVKGKK